jgi:hypothetical protein
MDVTSDSDQPALRHERRVTVPISFTADIAGFLFDLLSDIDAIVWEADADTQRSSSSTTACVTCSAMSRWT